MRVLHPWMRKPTRKKRFRSRYIAGWITAKTEVKGMDLAKAMEMGLGACGLVQCGLMQSRLRTLDFYKKKRTV